MLSLSRSRRSSHSNFYILLNPYQYSEVGIIIYFNQAVKIRLLINIILQHDIGYRIYCEKAKRLYIISVDSDSAFARCYADFSLLSHHIIIYDYDDKVNQRFPEV